MTAVWWRVAIFMGIMLILDDKLPAHITLVGVRPDLALIGLFLVTLREGAAVGAWTGFAAGLFIDVATPEDLGARALSLAAAGFFVGRVSGHVDVSSRLVLLILLTLMGLVDAFIYELAVGLTAPAQAMGRFVVVHLPNILYTLALAVLTFLVLGQRMSNVTRAVRR